MNAFDLVGASSSRPILKWLPLSGGLLAAGLVASVVCRLPVMHSLSWAELMSSAVTGIASVVLASALGVWGLCFVLQVPSGVAVRRLILRTSLDAVWLAPLVLFIRENSVWAMALAAVLVSRVANHLHLLQDPDWQGDADSSLPSYGGAQLSVPEPSPWFWRQVIATAAALCAQTAALTGLTGYALPGALLVGVSAAVWTWSFMNYGPDSPQSRSGSQSTPHILLVGAMAIVFMTGALIRYLPNTYRFGGFGVPSRQHSSRLLAHLDQRLQPGSETASQSGERHGQPGGKKASEDADSQPQTRSEEVSDGALAAARDANSGVIVWPKKQTFTKLVAPVPAKGNGLLVNNHHANPLVIPFNGVYWFFKAPDLHPPKTSREVHGSPELLDIHSTDRRPLSMEAHENLGSLLDLDCCSRIQIVIRNADVYQETVSLELILVNSSLRGKPSQSLGTMRVKSKRPWKIYEKPSPAGETLDFPIPANHSIRRFDEVMIVFRLDAFRADDGAKIAIDHFVLVPRGL